MSFFVGIAFDEATRAQVQRALTLAQPLAPGLKWVRPEKAHLTLVFCAEVKPDEGRIIEVAARHAPLALSLKGGGTFSRHVLWLGVSGDLEPLAALQRSLTEALGVRSDHPAYAPHVTLARNKRNGALPSQALAQLEGPPFRVERVTLFESRNGDYLQLMHASLLGTV
jgi:2'-5' RNA ligase